jgi:carbohydrate ABC transporter membrane protein 1, CUT1 family (TC 3.A.1.1.-)
MASTEADYLHIVTADNISAARIRFGKTIIWASAALLCVVSLVQYLDTQGVVSLGFETWRPTLYAFLIWASCLCWGQVLLYGERGKRALFVLPAALFVVAMVVFPLIFALGIAFPIGTCLRPQGVSSTGLTMSDRCGSTRSIGMR